MSETPDIVTIARAVEAFRGATAQVQAISDQLATTLYRLHLEERWLVPSYARPSCPLSGKPCTSWTCLQDVCAEPTSGRVTDDAERDV